MNRLLSFLIISLLTVSSIYAQRLSIDAPVYDCGQVQFMSPVSTKFVLKNNTTRSTTIRDVETSCGCTTALALKRTVGSGKELSVVVTYDAKTLGHFEKTVTIYEEGQMDPVCLTIKGVVLEEVQDYSGNYPFTVGNMRTDRDVIEFDDVTIGATPSQTIHILNATSQTIEPQVMHLPDYLQAEIHPGRLAPNKTGEITITLISSKLRDMGLSQTSIYLGNYPGDKVSADKEIATSAVLLPSFSNSEATAPKMELSTNELRRSQMSGKKDRLKGEIIIKNTGLGNLDISSLQMFTIGMKVSLGKSHLLPGETTKLKVQINDDELQNARQRPRILMITNDPKQTKVIINIR